jgi:hypothetical protein
MNENMPNLVGGLNSEDQNPTLRWDRRRYPFAFWCGGQGLGYWLLIIAVCVFQDHFPKAARVWEYEVCTRVDGRQLEEEKWVVEG